MLDMFSAAARRYIQERYGKSFIINYQDSNNTRICFDAQEQQGSHYVRIYLPLPDWTKTEIIARHSKRDNTDTILKEIDKL